MSGTAKRALKYTRSSDSQSLRRVAKALQSATRSAVWRQHVAIRTSSVARALHACTSTLGPTYAGREKSKGAWTIYALDREERVAAIVVLMPVVRHLVDFLERPIEVVIKRPELVSEPLLGIALRRKNQAMNGDGKKKKPSEANAGAK